MKLIRTKDDLGNEIYLNLDKFYAIEKSKTCDGKPSINFIGKDISWVHGFNSIEERDEVFNYIGTLS